MIVAEIFAMPVTAAVSKTEAALIGSCLSLSTSKAFKIRRKKTLPTTSNDLAEKGK
jgi:hypothetical protein